MKDERKTMNLPSPGQPLILTSPLPTTCAVASPGLIERGKAYLFTYYSCLIASRRNLCPLLKYFFSSTQD